MKRILPALLFVLVSVSASFSAESPALESNDSRPELEKMQAKPAPPLTLDSWLNGQPLSIEQLKGKIVVLDFWATWCGPCIKAIPHNNQLSKKYADKGVVIIGVCIQRGAETMAETVKKYGMAYPTGADTSGATQKAYKPNSFPDYYVIDRKGVLRWADIMNKDVEKAIETLLKES